MSAQPSKKGVGWGGARASVFGLRQRSAGARGFPTPEPSEACPPLTVLHLGRRGKVGLDELGLHAAVLELLDGLVELAPVQELPGRASERASEKGGGGDQRSASRELGVGGKGGRGGGEDPQNERGRREEG